MQKKKARNKIAKWIRQHGVSFIEAHKLAKAYVSHNGIFGWQTAEKLGYDVFPQQVPACGKGCCWADGDNILAKDRVRINEKELKNVVAYYMKYARTSNVYW